MRVKLRAPWVPGIMDTMGIPTCSLRGLQCEGICAPGQVFIFRCSMIQMAHIHSCWLKRRQ